jgi:hypothetical protein
MVSVPRAICPDAAVKVAFWRPQDLASGGHQAGWRRQWERPRDCLSLAPGHSAPTDDSSPAGRGPRRPHRPSRDDDTEPGRPGWTMSSWGLPFISGVTARSRIRRARRARDSLAITLASPWPAIGRKRPLRRVRLAGSQPERDGLGAGSRRLAARRPGQARHSIGTNRSVAKGHQGLPVSIAAVRVLGGLVILLVPGSITRSAERTDRTRRV